MTTKYTETGDGQALPLVRPRICKIAQLINYLKATGKRVGYLLNFGCPTSLEWKRIVI